MSPRHMLIVDTKILPLFGRFSYKAKNTKLCYASGTNLVEKWMCNADIVFGWNIFVKMWQYEES